MYIIQEQGKIILTDEDLQRLEDTLKFMPQYDKTNIEDFSDDLIVKAFDGSLYIKGYAPTPTKEEQRQARSNAYVKKVDTLMAEYNRKKTFNLFKEGEEDALLSEIETKVEEIKSLYPYPEEPIKAIEEPETLVEDYSNIE